MDKLSYAQALLERLKAAGYEAFIVGGAVRNTLLNVPIKDIDITTQATPDQIKAVFPESFEVNKALGTMMVQRASFSYEITTYRLEGVYDKHRRPLDVRFTQDVQHDLKRRDFTVNAMLMDETLTLIDPLNGHHDLTHRQLKAIGDPAERFEEDALRLLRAFRFIAEYGFELETQTAQAVSEKALLIQKIAIERVQDEWFKILRGAQVKQALQAMQATGFDAALYHLKPVIEQMLSWQTWPPLEAVFALTQPLASWQLKPFHLPHQWTQKIRHLDTTYQAVKTAGWTPLRLFEAGEEVIGWVEAMFQAEGLPPSSEDPLRRYEALPLHHRRELQLKGSQLKTLCPDLPQQFYQTLLDRLLEAVLNRTLDNTPQALSEAAITVGKELVHE